jgi:hypothetical protein
MRVNDLLEGRFVGYDLPNKKKAIKRFPNDWSPEAVAWMRSEIDPKDKDKAKYSKAKKEWYVLTRDQQIAAMHRKLGITAREPNYEPPAPRVPLKDVYNAFIDKVDRYFPDGDPMDYMGSFFRRRGIETNWGDWVNRAMKRFGTTTDERKGYAHYLGMLWEETARDRAADAEHMLKDGQDVDDGYPFFVIDDGKVKLEDNPYWSYIKQKTEREKRDKADAAWNKKHGIKEEAYPRYQHGQELIITGKEGFQGVMVNPSTEIIASDSKAEYLLRDQKHLFKNRESGYDWVIIFDHDDGQNVFFHAGKNLWKADREPFYGNVISRGKNFLNNLVDRSDDEDTPAV